MSEPSPTPANQPRGFDLVPAPALDAPDMTPPPGAAPGEAPKPALSGPGGQAGFELVAAPPPLSALEHGVAGATAFGLASLVATGITLAANPATFSARLPTSLGRVVLSGILGGLALSLAATRARKGQGLRLILEVVAIAVVWGLLGPAAMLASDPGMVGGSTESILGAVVRSVVSLHGALALVGRVVGLRLAATRTAAWNEGLVFATPSAVAVVLGIGVLAARVPSYAVSAATWPVVVAVALPLATRTVPRVFAGLGIVTRPES